MVEPITLTAGAIATLAFQEFVKSAAGESAKKLTGGILDKLNDLRKKIMAMLSGKQPDLDEALTRAEQGDETALPAIAQSLDAAMQQNPTFATELRTLAQQIQQEINIEQIQGRNIQAVYGGQGLQVNDPKQPVIQAGENAKFYFGVNESD